MDGTGRRGRREARALDGAPPGPPEGPRGATDDERDGFAAIDPIPGVMADVTLGGDPPTRSQDGDPAMAATTTRGRAPGPRSTALPGGGRAA